MRKKCNHNFCKHETVNVVTQEIGEVSYCSYCLKDYSSSDKFDELIGELEIVVKDIYPELRKKKVMDILLPFGRKLQKRASQNKLLTPPTPATSLINNLIEEK